MLVVDWKKKRFNTVVENVRHRLDVVGTPGRRDVRVADCLEQHLRALRDLLLGGDPADLVGRVVLIWDLRHDKYKFI